MNSTNLINYIFRIKFCLKVKCMYDRGQRILESIICSFCPSIFLPPNVFSCCQVLPQIRSDFCAVCHRSPHCVSWAVQRAADWSFWQDLCHPERCNLSLCRTWPRKTPKNWIIHRLTFCPFFLSENNLESLINDQRRKTNLISGLCSQRFWLTRFYRCMFIVYRFIFSTVDVVIINVL